MPTLTGFQEVKEKLDGHSDMLEVIYEFACAQMSLI